MGSTKEEGEYAYELDNGVTRSYGWYDREIRRNAKTGAFCIDRYPVTNSEYKSFIDDTRHTEPLLMRTSSRDFSLTLTKRSKSFSGGKDHFPQGIKITLWC
jgi:formylglycine-generating enzyme required for sulfatase activity